MPSTGVTEASRSGIITARRHSVMGLDEGERAVLSHLFNMKFIETNEKIVVYLGDSKILDESRVSEVGNGLAEIGDRAVNKRKLILDFRGVQFMSSAIIGEMVLLKKRTLQNNVRLKLVNVSDNVLEVFRIVRLDRVFDIGEDDDDQEPTGEGVPGPKPPRTLRGHADPPSG